MKLGRIMAEEMAKEGVKVIPGKGRLNASLDTLWVKWLSYEPEFEKERILYLESKKVSELSYEELNEVLIYKRNKLLVELFKRYGIKESSVEEYMLIYDYMNSHSIEELMLAKMTNEELRYAKEEITRLSGGTKEQLQAKINEGKQLDKLGMVDSYILYVISNIDYERSMLLLNQKIEGQLMQNEFMRKRSLYKASNPNYGE